MTDAIACRVCRSEQTSPLLDFGPQPNSMHLLTRRDEPFALHPLVLWSCASCGFVFIAHPMPPDVFYQDVQQPTLITPPPHLTPLLEELVATLPVRASILDIGANSGALLARFREAGFSRLHGIEPSATRQLALAQGLDVAAGYFTSAWAKDWRNAHGAPDLVICRHVLEHVTALDDFLDGLALLLDDGGMLLLETPDLQATADRGDCSVVWEQHVNYFDLPTLDLLLHRHGLRLVQARRIPFGGGAVLCSAVHHAHDGGGTPDARLLPDPGRPETLAHNVRRRMADLRQLVGSLRAGGSTVAGFGAGERGAMVINLCGLGEMLEYVVDDNTRKVGRFLSGSRLPVVSSEHLRQFPPDYCILFPMNGKEVEAKILRRLEDLARRGVSFLELFPASGDTVAVHAVGTPSEPFPCRPF